MKPNLKTFPMLKEKDWLLQEEVDFVGDAIKWKKDFEASLRSRIDNPDVCPYAEIKLLKEILGEDS